MCLSYLRLSGNNTTKVKGAANTTEARYNDSIGLRYSRYDALAYGEYRRTKLPYT